MSDGAIVVDSNLSIPRHELTFRASRAGGPGGQHVNTSSTRVELVWNAATSSAVPEELRPRMLERLRSRLDADGNVRVVASAHRSQARNREDAESKLASLVRRAIEVPKVRKRTAPSRSAKEERLRSKRRLSHKKRDRRRGHDDD